MDETQKAQQDSSARDSSGGDAGITSEQPKTHTEADITKAVSDALSAAGRDAKSISDKATEAERILGDAKKMQTDIQAERERWQKDKDEAELESVRDDPDALKSLGERQRQRNEAAKLATREKELDEREGKHQESVKSDLEQLKVFKRTQLAAEVAVAKGVDIDVILKLTKDDSREAMEATADLLSKTKPPLRTDSGRTIGGGRSFKQLEQDYADGKVPTAEYERALKEQGKI